MANLDNAKMIKDQDSWPQWPFLPVKRRAVGGGFPETGLIAADPDYRKGIINVYKANLFNLPQDPTGVEKITYQTVDAVLADGWVVD